MFGEEAPKTHPEQHGPKEAGRNKDGSENGVHVGLLALVIRWLELDFLTICGRRKSAFHQTHWRKPTPPRVGGSVFHLVVTPGGMKPGG